MKLLINYKTLFLILFLPLFYGWFRYLPDLSLVFDLTLVGILFSFLFFFRGLKYKIFKNVQSYIFFFLIFIPILGSTSAFFTYSQPIFYGLASYRNFILLLFVLILTKQLIKGSFTIKHLQSSFLFLAWVSLVVFGFIFTFINPNDLDANNFGNLCQRVTAFAIKNCNGKIPSEIEFQNDDLTILNKYNDNLDKIRLKIDEQNINFYIDYIINSLFEANKYFNDQEPWKKKNDPVRLNTIVYTTLEIVRKISFLLNPIIPVSSLKALKIFNLSQKDIKLQTISNNEFLTKGMNINKIDILFKKIEKEDD